MKSNLALYCLALSLLFTVPTFAEVGMIANGIDTWVTPSGSSYIDLVDDPIPAGFFCPDSEAFAGRINWQGMPITSSPSGALGNADTIVQRLDDAVFDRAGQGTTRLQVRALSLASIQPIQTSCGRFDVSAKLHGPQPITSMDIVRKNENSGHFNAKLAMNVRISFTPVGKQGRQSRTSRPLVIDRPILLNSDTARWTSDLPAANQVGQVGGFVLVDTDGDDSADTYLPGQSAFYTLGTAATKRPGPTECVSTTPGVFCHEDPSSNKCHCTTCQCLP